MQKESINSISGKRILAISGSFPSPKFPEHYIFVKNILEEMVRQGAVVDVISPYPWIRFIKTWRNKKQSVNYGQLRVFRPINTSIPLRFFGPLRKYLMAFNDAAMSRAIERSIPDNVHYDFCYAHFLDAARASIEPMKKRGIPIFLNFGESDPWDYDKLYEKDSWVESLSNVAGVITVSNANKEYLLKRNPNLIHKIQYIPNGVNIEKFKKIDQLKSRKELGLPLDDSIIAIFSGHFEERKGALRVLHAIKLLGMKCYLKGRL